ncbi:MAG: HAD family phosphatase [Phycisphaeraceae bacterium]|nr:HAD family phosphatase [Phycisphaeraceae bacterium]
MTAQTHKQHTDLPFDMVAIDLDGTLLRDDHQVTVRTVQTIAKAQKLGVKVVIATARPPRGMRHIAEALKIDTHWVTYNGAMIFDPQINKHIYHQPLSSDLARKIVKAARKTDKECVISLEILDKWYTDHVDDSLPTQISRNFAPDFVGPLEAFLKVPITKLLVLAPAQRIPKIRLAVEKKFGDQVTAAITDHHLLQYIHKDADKRIALKKVASLYDIDVSRVMCIGDAPNDASMLKWAGLGAAVESGWQVAKDAADVIVPSNQEGGVAYAIRKYVLGENLK